ncbi:efflux RND transporter periplasmic adaptor subunit [Luteibacter sp. ME-Dv--P-043b]|uniref:efflux RND transporter periplasmic adaptor subunit n=1 Tax=Luteibacter sp. ME-Dv--P-043b TaxID=3040291 RepID=UPI00255404FA|nr:efflux RND transporter periplasmic adaptor subunit [Luteibacter sp. ME-Dv--P-043b]
MNQEPAKSFGRHRAMLIGFPVTVVVAIALWALYVDGSERTDDAYVEGNVVQVTSQVAGTVTAINADDTESVAAGAPLVKLNAVDNEVQFERAKAALAAATRAARVQFHQVDQLRAEVASRENDVARAIADVRRRNEVGDSGAVSKEEIDHAEDVLRVARNGLEGTKQQLAQRLAMTDRLTMENQPDVLAAASRLKDAYVALGRTTIPAPVDGTVTRRTVQVGQHIPAGASLMSIVPLNEIWVDANFKESQLADIRIGQRATLKADLYGGGVTFHGKVIGLDAGTGSAFALLPAQNATGNWIKVTQRVPVRIVLDPQELRHNALRLGLSMHVVVDTTDLRGERPTTQSEGRTAYGTRVFDNEMHDADGLVSQIIAANSGADDGK